MILQVVEGEKKKLQFAITEINKLETSKEFFKRSWNSYYKFLSKEWKNFQNNLYVNENVNFKLEIIGGGGGGERNAMQMLHNLFLQERKGAIRGVNSSWREFGSKFRRNSSICNFI